MLEKMFNREVVKVSTQVNRTFAYELDTISLKFTLRVDEKKGLIKFKKLLEMALKDVTEEIAQ